MSSHCVEKIVHEECGGDDLQVFEEDGKYTGYCFNCDTYIPDPYGEGGPPPKKRLKTKTPEQIAEEIEEIKSYPVVDIPDRKLKSWALDYFGVKVGLSEVDGATPTTMYYPYEGGYKVRLLEHKKFWALGDIKKGKLFGWKQALGTGGKKLFITEGENDAIALFQALVDKQRGSKWEHLRPAVVSLRSGASGAEKEIRECLSDIKANFKEVVLVFDMDDAGEDAAQKVLKILPTATRSSLPCKDANACIMEGKSLALANAALFKSETPKNTRLIAGSTLYEAAKQPAEWGLSWPWQGVTELTRGIRFGETIYLGSGVKMGKSEVVNTLAVHLMVEHGLKVFLVKPEEVNKKTYKMILGKAVGKFFHDPKVEFDEEAYNAAAEMIGDKLYMLDLYQHLGWDSLQTDIQQAAALGCKAVFIDPITNLTNGKEAGQANTILQEIAQELSAMAKDLDIVIFIFCHLKSPESGPSHERGGKVYSNQFAGSRSMMRSCNYMFGMEGDKDPEKSIEERNMRQLVLLEDREFGESGVVNLYWNHKNSLFTEVKS